MAWQMVLAASLAEAFGAFCQSTTGLGLNLVSVPLLLLIDVAYVPGPVVLMTMLVCLAILARDHQPGLMRRNMWVLSGRVPGSLLGIGALSVMGSRELYLLAAFAIVLGAALSGSSLRVPNLPIPEMGVGAAAALFATSVGVGGPPLAVHYRFRRLQDVRSAIALNGVVGGGLSLVLLLASRQVPEHGLMLTLTLIPGALLGFAAATLVPKHALDRYKLHAIIGWSVLAGLALLARAAGLL